MVAAFHVKYDEKKLYGTKPEEGAVLSAQMEPKLFNIQLKKHGSKTDACHFQ